MGAAVAVKSSSPVLADADGSGLAASGDVAVSEPPAAGVTGSSRLYYLDWIRVLALLFVLLVHTLAGTGVTPVFLSFPDFGKAVISIVGITVFFIVSGAASMFSLERRTPRQFLCERVLRLGVPFLVGGAVLVPLAYYVSPGLISEYFPDFQGSLWGFYGAWFSATLGNLSWQTNIFEVFGSWLWVLGFLFVYSVVGLPVLQWLRSASADRFLAFTTRLASYRGGLIVWVVPVVVLAVVGEAALLVLNIQPVDSANSTDVYYFFYFGWGGLMRLFGLFLLGAVLVRNREVLQFVRRDWLIALLVMTPGILLALWAYSQSGDNAAFWMVVQIGFTVASWCFALVVVAAGQRWLNRPGRLLAYSLGVIVAFYVLHVLVLSGVEYVAFVWIGVDGLYEQAPWVLGLIVLVVSFAALIAVIELVVRPVGPLRKFLGVTKERIPGQYNKKVADHEQRAVEQNESANLQKNSANRSRERELVASADNPTRI